MTSMNPQDAAALEAERAASAVEAQREQAARAALASELPGLDLSGLSDEQICAAPGAHIRRLSVAVQALAELTIGVGA